MQEEDLSSVLDIGRQSMAHPWSRVQLNGELQFPGGVLLVAEQGCLCGYAFFRQAGPEAELLQLAVLPACRRQGVGSTLVRSGLKRLYNRQAEVCFLEVRSRDAAAYDFYLQVGFQQVGRRRNYYSSPVDDAVIMRMELEEDEKRNNAVCSKESYNGQC